MLPKCPRRFSEQHEIESFLPELGGFYRNLVCFILLFFYDEVVNLVSYFTFGLNRVARLLNMRDTPDADEVFLKRFSLCKLRYALGA